MSEQGIDMKYDGGKILAAIPFEDFPLALKAVAEVATFGANKYERASWKNVKNAHQRYTDAKFRHILEGMNSERDDESGLLHAAHEAWNVLATLQLKLEQEKKSFNFTKVGQDNRTYQIDAIPLTGNSQVYGYKD